MSNVVDNLYVVGMGLGVVFIGLISIIILCYIIGAICMSSGKKEDTDRKPSGNYCGGICRPCGGNGNRYFRNQNFVLQKNLRKRC